MAFPFPHTPNGHTTFKVNLSFAAVRSACPFHPANSPLSTPFNSITAWRFQRQCRRQSHRHKLEWRNNNFLRFNNIRVIQIQLDDKFRRRPWIECSAIGLPCVYLLLFACSNTMNHSRCLFRWQCCIRV